MKQLVVLLSVLLAIASCCPDGHFSCTSRDCLPAQLVCDFKEDCKDGSDEEFCGSCNFEDHPCGWKNTSDSTYRWSWQMANITTIPGLDHTTGSPWGHVMHIDGKQGELEYFVNLTAGLGCQISFWYHIYDPKPSPISSSKLLLKMVRGDNQKDLLEISKDKTNGWENATAFVSNQPGGYKLLFSYRPLFTDTVNVLLDDINFENCGEEDVPDGSDRLSCDFEKDTCSWYHDYTANLMWNRINGQFGDINGNGFFMVIQAASNLNLSSAARLIGFLQPAGQTTCVSFFYYIFGNSIGSLKFIAKHSGEAETVVWMRSGTQGNKWRFADLTFNSDKPIQFIIEAVVGGKQGSIAIDDIVVSTSSCPPERECTFQGSLCGLQPQPSADFSWNRITGMSQPANSSGPTKDHTLGTDQGYYLSAELWRHSVGSRGSMMTAVMKPTPSNGECLMFWYYMEGRGVGELNVYIQTAESHESPTKLWTRRGDQGTHWRHGRVTLLSPNTNYQMTFEAIAGDGLRRDIAIDDFTVLNGACPPTGFCDFEMDFCGWVNSPPPESGVDWDWLSGESEGQMVPRWDHTTNSPLGHFAFFKVFESKEEKIAQLETEFMDAVDRACLEIWHIANGWSVNRPSYITLTVFVNEMGELRPLFNTSGFVNNTWIQDRVEYSASGQHQIILQARCPGSKEDSFSLDDIHIIRGQSCDDSVLTTTPNPPTTTTAPDSTMDCTFEQGFCNWVQDVSDDMNWTLSNGLQVDGPWSGPLYDHTVGNNQGFFLLLNGSGSKADEKAGISVPVVNQWSQSCVGFWYYMLGPSVSTLNLLIKNKSSELLVWTRQGTQNSEWLKAEVSTHMSDVLQIVFTGHRNTHSQGFIAIDDITVREGACSSQNLCGFDSDSCGFENSANHLGQWERRRGTKHNEDHTYGTENGFYMTVVSSDPTQHEEAELLSPEFTSAAEMCVRFWYQLSADPSHSLAVHVLRSETYGRALWHRSGSPLPSWEVAEVTVSSPPNFYVVFKAAHAPGSNEPVKLDDFSVREGACRPPATCDFESGQCSWVNILTEDEHEWVLAHGGSHGPPTDHTSQTSDGWFLLSSAQNQNHPIIAQVLSEWIQLKHASSCLTLWYHMDNSHSGTLRVFVRSGPSEDTLILHSNSSSSSWRRFSQSVEMSKPFQFLIEAETKNNGFVAIDDISLTPGLCQENETSSAFVGCSFENGTCDWEDISVGPFQWVRRNAGGSSGPSVDNTGWYMTVEADRGEEMSPAALQSPKKKEASATCTLRFYYNMYGDDSTLRVLLKGGSTTSTLWWLSGNHGDSWQNSEVLIGRIPQDFTIMFQASRDFNRPGHIAIDDVSFTNCSFPEPDPACPESMFKCNSGVCVDLNSVCDFNNDCGDRSDENDCGKQGVVERCSFEQGLCSWSKSDVDSHGAEWTHRRGQEAWPDHGPPRDHTRNSAAGHYATPGLHLTERGQTSEILSKTLLPSLKCSVRFFYFSVDDVAARLTTQSRTILSGTDDKLLWVRGSAQSYSWQRAEVTFSSSDRSKIAFRYELGEAPRGLVAVDDVSFSKECVFDPENSELPDTTPTSISPTSSTAPVNPCQVDEFFCHHSAGNMCLPETLQCDYHPDCPQGEDEAGCGPCTFESDQCRWTDSSDGQSKWLRQKASNATDPPTDHTTETGFYMRVNISQGSTPMEAKLISPLLPPSSPYCQILFHFHISTESTGSLRVLMQQAEGGEAILWSRSHNTVSHWTPVHLPVGLHQQPYKLWFSSKSKAAQEVNAGGDHIVAVDDISFLNCEKSYQPPDLSSLNCTFEDDLCLWVQGAEGELDWLSRSGPTETPNTGPAGDHTTGKGKYLYIESSHPSMKGNTARLKSSLLPSAGENGYYFTFWYHMFGSTVGSLKMLLKTTDTLEETLVWQKSGNQGDEWLLARIHMTLQRVHQVVLEASVGGEAGDIAIDDLGFIRRPSPASDLCDFEEGSCNWQQVTNDDIDWVRQSGSDSNTGPKTDHTTSTATGHYYYLPFSVSDQGGQTAAMMSPLYPTSKGSCVQLWYYMYMKGIGMLNVYQQSEDGKKVLIFSQMEDQGQLWRFAEASLMPRIQPYRIVVEAVKVDPMLAGDMAFDDVHLTDSQCPRGFCDFESSLCSWSNLGGGVDQGDWLRGAGASPNPNTGPAVDHTTNSTHGHYVYVDSSVGEWGDESFLISDVIHPSSRGHCLTFWYHMYGNHVGTLKVYMNNREMQDGGNEEGLLLWIETGNKGDRWLQSSLTIKHEKAFWFMFVYQRGMNTGGDVALDDITITPSSCFSEPPIHPSDNNALSVGVAVGLTLLAGVIIAVLVFMLNRRWSSINQPICIDDKETDQNSTFNMGTEHESDFSFFNNLFDPSTDVRGATVDTSDV